MLERVICEKIFRYDFSLVTYAFTENLFTREDFTKKGLFSVIST